MGRALLVNSLPTDQNLKKMVKEMSAYAGNLYVTDASEDVYSKFGSTWSDFVDAVAALD
jgi:fructoselysine-6-P-deglycase FrlB-like protein